MTLWRLLLTFAVVGTLFGIFAATWAYPSVISAELCGFGSGANSLNAPCKDKVDAATSKLISAQLNGAGAGALLGLALGGGFSFWRRRRAKRASAGGSGASAPPPA